MSRATRQFYEFGPFRIDVTERLLLRDGEVVPLTPKVFDTLLMLVENSGHILSKNEMMKRVWADSIVEEASLTKNISVLRKALGQTPETDQYIETIPWRGYRFLVGVRELSENGVEPIVQDSSISRPLIGQENASSAGEQVSAAPTAVETPSESGGWQSATRRATLIVIGAALIIVITATVLFVTGRKTKPDSPHPQTLRTIAVLPFKSLSPEAGDDYLGLGMADTLIIRLSNIQQIIVRPTSSIRKYSSSDQDALIAGREQQVDSVLDGSIHRAEGRIRVTANLINVLDGKSLWAGSFDEKDGDILKLQDSIVERLARALTLELTGEEQKRLTKRYTENSEAYLLYLRGRYHLERRTLKDVETSIDYFKRAINIDPQYALAYAGLAESYSSLSVLGAVPAKAVMPRAKDASMQALALDDQLAEAYTSLGLIKTIYDWDWAGAEQAHQHALKLNPNSALAHRLYGHLLRTTGRLDDALVEFNHALSLEPLSLVANRDVGVTLYVARQYDRAIEQFQKTLELDPGFATVYGFLERAYEASGNYEQAIAADLKAVTVQQNGPATVDALRHAYTLSGWKAYWHKRLGLEKERAYAAPSQMVLIYARLGEKDSAFEWLEKSYQERDFWLNFIKIDPLLDSLRDDARFIDMLQRVGLAQ